MKRVLIFLLTLALFSLAIPATVLALTPDFYAAQVIKKDLPQAQGWLKRLAEVPSQTQADAYVLYQSALPESQGNHQQGISIKGSLERMLLLLDGARYFSQVELASQEFHSKKERVFKVLQIAKDHLDRMQIGEDPQVLLEEWGVAVRENNVNLEFEADVLAVFTDLNRLFEPKPSLVQSDTADSGVSQSFGDPNFEAQRFSSYVEMAEAPTLAEECREATRWRTDRAESCQSDDPLECDRNYARQCKKLE